MGRLKEGCKENLTASGELYY